MRMKAVQVTVEAVPMMVEAVPRVIEAVPMTLDCWQGRVDQRPQNSRRQKRSIQML